MHLDDVLRRGPGLDLTLMAGPWDARIVERVSIIDDPAGVATAHRGELVVLTRRASRSATGYALIELLEIAGERELAALALYGRATTSQALIAAASSARVALLAVGIGEDPAALAFALEAVLHADADAVLRRLTAAVAAIEHAEPDGAEAILVAASAALEAEVRLRDGEVVADRTDTAIRIGCRLVADAIARSQSYPEPSAGGGTVILVESEGQDGGDLVVLEALRVGHGLGGTLPAMVTAFASPATAKRQEWRQRSSSRLSVSVVCGVGADAGQARAALARARAAGVVDVPLRFDAADPDGLVHELAGSPTARESAAGLLAPLEKLGERRAATAIETLRVYLDCWGSLARSGRMLHLHPNAVAHRMKRIRAVLPADLDDPQQRLALQIACRVWRQTST